MDNDDRDYPNAYRALATDDRATKRPEVFDPALKHFARAFRFGDPEFPTPEARQAWHATRLQVVEHLLRIITESAWSEHLVLRGSLLLTAWLGREAREPGDMDWVFRPSDVTIDAPLAQAMEKDLIQRVSENSQVGDATILVEQIAVDHIWTYERAAGRRIVFPWQGSVGPSGTVQMDVVFGEELYQEPIQTPIPFPQQSIVAWTADKALSLAWKLLWLETDAYPQGKDLYDATLLAEQTSLSRDLLTQVLQSEQELAPDFPMKWAVEWDTFQREYPSIPGKAIDWQARLTAALTF